jgi:LacI family transcriptional regulator, galactose operon repressor
LPPIRRGMANATIRDVARRAQVSVASVSRALNGLHNVSDETRARVTDAARDLGYVPHAGARSLSLARTNAIGVVLPALHGEFFSEIVRGMDEVASAGNYFLLLSNMHTEASSSTAVLRAMRGRVDGLLLMAPHVQDQELVEALPSGLPTLLINSPGRHPDCPGIHLDNAAGAEAVAEHLLGLGRRRLVHISGPEGNIDAQERADAFRQAVDRYPGATLQIVQGDFYEESGERAVKLLLDDGVEFDAIFAANDNMAIGAVEALRRAGLHVPEDVAVAGFDDIPLAKHLGLTTVRVRIAELGQHALQRLLQMLGGTDAGGDELHQPELVVRSTTKAGGDS